jgi:hypothetical protein
MATVRRKSQGLTFHHNKHRRVAGIAPGHEYRLGTARTIDCRGSSRPGLAGDAGLAGPGADFGRSRRRSGLPADVRTSWGAIRVAM